MKLVRGAKDWSLRVKLESGAQACKCDVGLVYQDFCIQVNMYMMCTSNYYKNQDVQCSIYYTR